MMRSIKDNSPQPEAVRLLGDILLKMKIVDKYDLHWAMETAVAQQRPLGEVLLELELATPEQIQLALDHQHRARH